MYFAVRTGARIGSSPVSTNWLRVLGVLEVQVDTIPRVVLLPRHELELDGIRVLLREGVGRGVAQEILRTSQRRIASGVGGRSSMGSLERHQQC